MKHVFVSYAREDLKFVTKLRKQLQDSGLTAWQDLRSLRPGKPWRPAVDQALREADALIVVMSPAAADSRYVLYEWAFALGAQIEIIPVLHRETELHDWLDDLEYIDFTEPRKGKPWMRLLQSLPSRLKRVRPQIHARFCMAGKEPEVVDDDYVISVSLRQVPRNTERVTYTLYDERLQKLKWSTRSADREIEFYSDGDVHIKVTIERSSGKPVILKSSLFDALRRTHGRDRNDAVRRALLHIREH